MARAPEATTDFERQKADLERYGFCIAADALDPKTLDAARKRLTEQAEAERRLGIHKPGTDEEPGEMVNQWVHMLVNKGRVFHEIALDPTGLGLARHVLGEEILLSDLAAHITWPDNGLMGLHTDQWWMPQPVMPGQDYRRPGSISRANVATGDPAVTDRPIAPPVVVNVFWAITDFTAENGATRLVPGSHLSGRNPDPARDYECVQAIVPAGSAVVWEGRTWHAAGLNRSNGPRIGITAYYTAPQFRQMSNRTYGTKEAALDGAPRELKALMGFKSWSGYGRTGDTYNDIIEPAENLVGELKG